MGFAAGIISLMMSPQPQPTIRVLLADDHVVVRAGIRQFLEQSPDIQVVAEASNGQEACALLEQITARCGRPGYPDALDERD